MNSQQQKDSQSNTFSLTGVKFMQLMFSTLIPALMIIGFVLMQLWKVKKSEQIPKWLLKGLGCCIFATICAGMVITGNMHLIYVGGFTGILGIPSLLIIL